ncbi:MAG: selenide, water dikinase SelD [Phascolarctobacterium sp.]|nr:selenide, water dikinase SelD [Phascolarctobacterium sp.]
MMENEVKLTKLASCAGCGAKVGAGTLCQLLEGFASHYDERLLVGYDKSDDASVYKITDEQAIVQTTDFFPPIVDDPFMYGQIAATNALSDVYAMGGEPRLALNIMCIPEKMDKATVQEILRGGYTKAYEAGAIITGGHTIHGAEPIYGLAVTGFVHPDRLWRNLGAQPGDVLLLTKKLGVGVLTTGAKADLVEPALLEQVYAQMSTLNKYARDILVKYSVHACTDVTGFALLGHSLEMAQGSDVSVHIKVSELPYYEEALELASMGFIPAGAYRNREFAEAQVQVVGEIPLALKDLCYDPQTSGGLLCAIPQTEAESCLTELQAVAPATQIVGYVTEKQEKSIYLEA